MLIKSGGAKSVITFCYLPKCLPNEVINLLLGDLAQLAMEVSREACNKLIADGAPYHPVVLPTDASYYKHVPSKLYGLFDAMYRSACTEHNRVMNRAELAIHGIQLDIVSLLTNYQLKRRRN